MTPQPPSRPSEPILVKVAPEILEHMKTGDVEPVVILGVEEQDDGTYDMTLMNPKHGKRRVTPEKMAQAFHEAYEALAPGFGYSTREDSAVPWEDVPEANKALMLATVRNVLIEQRLEIGQADA